VPDEARRRTSPGDDGGGPYVFDMLDLELLHNFTSATYATLTSDGVAREAWRITGVRVALGCHFVMRALLAVSGMHLAHFGASARRDAYLTRALRHHREASMAAMSIMEKGTKEHGEQLYLFSALTVYFGGSHSPRLLPEGLLTISKALASPRTGEHSAEGENFPDWFFLVRGSRHILDITKYHLDGYTGQLVPLLKHGRRRWQILHDPKKTRPGLLSDGECLLLCSAYSSTM
jgi:hypothetical protein